MTNEGIPTNLRLRPNIGFGLGILVLVAAAWLSYANANKFAESNQWVVHTYEVLAATFDITANLDDVETGQRGYVITGKEEYLDPYRSGVAKIDGALARFKELTSDNPRQQRRFDEIKPLVAARLEAAGETIQLRREKGFEAAQQVILTGKGMRYMDDIRKVVAEMQDDERKLLVERQEGTTAGNATTRNMIVFGALAAVIVIVLIGYSFHKMVGKLEELLAAVSTTTSTLASTSSELLAGTMQQSASAQEQAAAVTETVTTVDEVQRTAEQAALRARAVAEAAQRTAAVGVTGRQAVDESVAAMATVKEQTESIAQSILVLAERAQAIGEIIASVNDVAEQTNLLALNAGIEAARAGEQGAGFTVVAREIKDLADQAKKATTQVRQILGEIRKATNSAAMVTEEGTRTVNTTIKTITRAGEIIRVLATNSEEATTAANQITASAAQQATGMSQVQQAMRDISLASNQGAAATKQAEQAAQDLSALGARLKQLLTA
jgi:methyl-accepting chemotaxis protein